MQDKIARLVLERFEALPKSGKPDSEEWTVLSAIVKENNSNLEIVALGTGSKCIGKNSMSKNGDILNDSHAEVIARRGFLKYLYSEIERDFESEIFDRKDGIFVLKSDIKFHFFTTHMPCGDAAIFPQDFGKCLDGPFKRKNDSAEFCKRLKTSDGDIFRTGGKCLEEEVHFEGSGYHLLGKVRTKPGMKPKLNVSQFTRTNFRSRRSNSLNVLQ